MEAVIDPPSQASPGADPARPVVETGWRQIVIVTAIMFAALLETLDSTIVNVSLPTIEGNIGASIDEGIWIITGYIISNVVSIPLNPLLIRLFGRRRYFATCIAGFTIASVLCSSSHTLVALVCFRVVQGAFGGGLIATSQGVMRDTFPPRALGVSSALFAIALLLGPALGPVVGGYLTDNYSWQWIFDVNIVPGTIAALVVATMLRDPSEPQRVSIDWLGLGLLATGLGALQILLDNGERNDWFSDNGMLAAGIIALVALASFAWWQWSGTSRPVVDLHVLRFRSVWVGSLIGMTFGAIIFVPAIVTPLYTSLVLSYTPWDSGLLLISRAIPVVVFTPLFAALAQNGVDVRYMLGSGLALTAAAMWWLDASMTPATPFATLAWPLILSGIGQSMLLVPLIVGVLTTTPAQLNGKISPIITLSVQLGGSIASAATIAVFDRRTSFHATILAGASNLHQLAINGLAPTQATLRTLAGLVNEQASTLGFADTLLALGLLVAVVFPLVLAFPRSQKATP
ncbi:MAG TPA: DHA2 family efflux MFS transporter permease subunit [Candidatus Acidoferrales bacterium]|nr:DHA2 family efflux MFS transporter permease subunit [Candidatus Acidoferrales bacterium]